MKYCQKVVILALLLLPNFCWGAEPSAPKPIDFTHHWAGYSALLIMIVAYIVAVFEDITELRKSTPMLLASGLIWTLIVFAHKLNGDLQPAVNKFSSNLLSYAELLLFIMVSMSYLNRLEGMQVFDALRAWLESKKMSYRQLFWVTGVLVFFMSFILNGLTAGLLMGAIVLAVGRQNAQFVSLACINIVVATNAGGSVSPLGGISTLFVWQQGMLKFTDFFALLAPCLANFLVPAFIMQFAIPKEFPSTKTNTEVVKLHRGAKIVLLLFGLTIALAVISDMFLHLPAAFGMMAGLSFLNLYNYYLQKSPYERRKTAEEVFSNMANTNIAHGTVRHQFYNISEEVGDLDWDTLLFFYGAMMGIGGLGYIGYLDAISQMLYGQMSPTIANTVIGLSSAVVDNGTLMFAILSMHPDLTQGQWLLLTLTLGVGGSLTAIGSAPGIGLLGISKGQYTFSSHMKWFPVILLGYFASIGVHFLVNAHYF